MSVTVELVRRARDLRPARSRRQRAGGGRTFYDVSLEVRSPLPTASRTRSTTALSPPACEVSDAASYRLIETLASAVADELAARFAAERVTVRVRKPGISPAGITVAYSAATAERQPDRASTSPNGHDGRGRGRGTRSSPFGSRSRTESRCGRRPAARGHHVTAAYRPLLHDVPRARRPERVDVRAGSNRRRDLPASGTQTR